MEDYEKAHIEENLWELIQSTFCNVQLIAKLQQANILQQADVEDLQRVHLTPLERSRRLYEILPTRINAYTVLTEALEDVRQTAAVRILKNVDPSRPISKPVFLSKSYETTFQKGVDRQKFVQNLIVILNLSVEFAKELLSYINSVDSDGNNIMFMATLAGLPIDILRGLEEIGGNWNAVNNAGETVLHVAAAAGHSEAIKYFAQLGVNVDRVNNQGQTPLQYAVTTEGNLMTTIQALLDCGADINAGSKSADTVLHEFIKTGKSKAQLEFLVRNGAKWHYEPEEDFSYLHQACLYGNNEANQYLLSLGYDANLKNKAGKTPLHTLAKHCSNNFQECFNTLIENGAEINTLDSSEETPIFKALYHNQLRNATDIQLMVQSGANLKIANIRGYLPTNYSYTWDTEIQKYVKTLNVNYTKVCGWQFQTNVLSILGFSVLGFSVFALIILVLYFKLME